MPSNGAEAAAELSKQLITLSTGLTALTVTFADKFTVPNTVISVPSTLAVAWGAFILTVLFGIWSQMAITGTINAAALTATTPNVDTPNIRFPAFLMIATFFVGLVFTTIAGYQKFNASDFFMNEKTIPTDQTPPSNN
jgi:hypothetical protein